MEEDVVCMVGMTGDGDVLSSYIPLIVVPLNRGSLVARFFMTKTKE